MRRDKILDGLRGLGCLLMILAHSHGYGKTIDKNFTLYLFQLGQFAPVFFFSSLGISLPYQFKKKSNFQIVAVYILLFIISFANMGLRLRFKDYITWEDGNLYASLAISALFIFLVLRNSWISIIIIPFIILFVTHNTSFGISLFYGGIFSFIPWVLFALFGLFLHIYKHYVKPVSFAALVLSILLVLTNNAGIFGAYNTPFYFVFGMFLYSFFILILPNLMKEGIFSLFIAYLGHYSLLFYVVHRILILYMPYKLFAPIAWIILLTITVLIMKITAVVNNLIFIRYSNKSIFWATLITLMLLPSLTLMTIHFQRAIMLTVLMLHAFNYHAFMNRRVHDEHRQ